MNEAIEQDDGGNQKISSNDTQGWQATGQRAAAQNALDWPI
jgi:hypothetical protein